MNCYACITNPKIVPILVFQSMTLVTSKAGTATVKEFDNKYG